jgi:uncharacterized protein (TIGR03643 family)
MESINIFERNKEMLVGLAINKDKIIEAKIATQFNESEIDRIIQMAWEDRTPFEAIEQQFGLKEKNVIAFMRANSKLSSFKMWRKRMTARRTKHQAKRETTVDRFKCTMQRSTGNKIAKR